MSAARRRAAKTGSGANRPRGCKQSLKAHLRDRGFGPALVDKRPGILFVLDAQARVLRHNADLVRVTARHAEELRGLDAFTDIVAAGRDMART
jgi:hypothetical protein